MSVSERQLEIAAEVSAYLNEHIAGLAWEEIVGVLAAATGFVAGTIRGAIADPELRKPYMDAMRRALDAFDEATDEELDRAPVTKGTA